MITKSTKKLVLGCKNSIIPNDVISIGATAFVAVQDIETLILPEGLKNIEGNAFQYSSIENIEIPNSVETYGSGVFAYCSNLKSVKLSTGATVINTSMFAYCTSLIEIEIPEGYIEIGQAAFANSTALATIHLPSSLTTVGYAAFGNTGLTDVYYAGTSAEFANISINTTDYGNPFSNVTMHYAE